MRTLLRISLATGVLTSLASVSSAQWTGSVNMNLSLVHDTINRTALVVFADAKQDMGTASIVAKGIYSYHKTTVVHQDRALLYGQYSADLARNQYWYASLQADWDKISGIKDRFIGSVGYGIYVHRDKEINASGKWRLQFDAGVSQTRESYTGGGSKSRTGARIGMNYARGLGKNFVLTSDVQYYPGFGRGNEYFMYADVKVTAALSAQWSATAGYIAQINSRPPVGAVKQTTTYLLALGYRF